VSGRGGRPANHSSSVTVGARNFTVIHKGANACVTPFSLGTEPLFASASLLMVQCEISADAVAIARAAERGVPVLFDPAPAGRGGATGFQNSSASRPTLRIGGTHGSVR
jgi:hypothetical protein